MDNDIVIESNNTQIIHSLGSFSNLMEKTVVLANSEIVGDHIKLLLFSKEFSDISFTFPNQSEIIYRLTLFQSQNDYFPFKSLF